MNRQPASDRHWYITERWQYFEAERRVNLLRLMAIGVFYTVHLLHYWSLQGQVSALRFLQLNDGATVDPNFHTSVTLLALGWVMLCVGTVLCLNKQILPWWLKYFSTGCDLFFLTAILYLASGPASPLVSGYFLLIAMATLRMNLPLVWFVTIGSLCGYVGLLGCTKWPETFWRAGTDISIPRYHQLIILLALVLTGVILGQVIRSVRSMASRYQSLQAGTGDNP